MWRLTAVTRTAPSTARWTTCALAGPRFDPVKLLPVQRPGEARHSGSQGCGEQVAAEDDVEGTETARSAQRMRHVACLPCSRGKRADLRRYRSGGSSCGPWKNHDLLDKDRTRHRVEQVPVELSDPATASVGIGDECQDA